MRIPPIPPSTILSHKNYRVARELVKSDNGVEPRCPRNVTMSSFDKLLEVYKSYPSNNKNWYKVEEFFNFLKDLPEEEGDAEWSPPLNLDDSPFFEPNLETLLDFKEPKTEEINDLQHRVREALENMDSAKVEGNINKIKKAIKESFADVISRNAIRDNKYRKFQVTNCGIRDLIRSNEKSMFANDHLETMGLLKGINNELTSIQSIESDKKVLFVMLDDSGSMDRTDKQAYVLLAYLKMLEELNPNVDVYIKGFESHLYEETWDLKEGIPDFGFNGGGTDIQQSIHEYFRFIDHNFENLENYSMLIINDGQDDLTEFSPPCRVNAIMLMQNNNMVEKVCKGTGGVAFCIT